MDGYPKEGASNDLGAISEGPVSDLDRSGSALDSDSDDQWRPTIANKPSRARRISDLMRSVYLRIGIHAAPPGTLFHFLNATARSTFNRSRALMAGERYELADLPSRSQDFILAFRISGGIGDHLISARYIRDLVSVIGRVTFDVYSSRPVAAQWIFASFPGFRKVFKEYHLFGTSALKHYQASFWLMSFVDLLWSPDEKIAPRVGVDTERLALICKEIARFNTKIRYFIDVHPRLDGYLAEIALRHGWTRTTFLQGVSRIKYGGDRLDISTDRTALDTFGLTGKIYVTIHNGYDPEEGERVDPAHTATKNYPHFGEVVKLLREEFDGLLVLQIGAATSKPICGVHLDLIGRTTFEQTAEIIKNSLLHLDGESGIVHLAACLGAKSCVIFGPTSQNYFAYEDNINIPPGSCGNCWWMTPEWLKRCPRGFREARCLSEIPPERIVAAVRRHLQEGIGLNVTVS